MTESFQPGFAELLARAREGEPAAIRALFPLVYDQLKRVASTQRRRGSAASLNTTALVHEAFIRLAGNDHLAVRDQPHFMAVAAMAMRQVLIDHARARLAAKRGGNARIIPFDEIETALAAGPDFSDGQAEALLALDTALTRLAERAARQSRVVECRFYAGMSIDETARALGVSPATVKRDWAMAQTWLYRDLQGAFE